MGKMIPTFSDYKPDRLVRTPLAATLLGVSDSFLQKDRQRAEPRVPYVTIGGAVRYRIADLQSFVERNVRGTN